MRSARRCPRDRGQQRHNLRGAQSHQRGDTPRRRPALERSLRRCRDEPHGVFALYLPQCEQRGFPHAVIGFWALGCTPRWSRLRTNRPSRELDFRMERACSRIASPGA
jgi:hypothetical protein